MQFPEIPAKPVIGFNMLIIISKSAGTKCVCQSFMALAVVLAMLAGLTK